MSERLARLGQTNWAGANEQTLREELIFPVLDELGYGQSTLNPIRREPSYQLVDPYLFEGRHRVRIDYLPTVLGRELWVLEAKGSDDKDPYRTLRQARSYAVHPEIRAPLLAVFDDTAIRVYDPWRLEWETPITDVPVAELASRFDELHSALSPDGVARLVRRQHALHVERALSATLDLSEIDAARAEFDQVFARAEREIQANRERIAKEVRDEVAAGWDQVLRSTGVWAVAQQNNTVWVGVGQDVSDLVTAVRARPPALREAELRSADEAVAAQTRLFQDDAEPASRPLWYWRFVKTAGAMRLRRLAGCESLATELTRQGLRDALLNFPDDPTVREAHRLELAFARMSARLSYARDLVDFEELADEINAKRSQEDQLRLPISGDMFRRLLVDNATRRILATSEWRAEALADLAQAAERLLGVYPRPAEVPERTMWDDPPLEDWADVEPLCDCTLVTLMSGGAEDLLCDDSELLDGLRELAQRTETRTGPRAQSVLDRLTRTGPVATPPPWWLALGEDEPDAGPEAAG